MIQFKKIYDHGDGAMSIGPKQNNGDFDWWPVLKVDYLEDYFSENDADKYLVTLMAVSPSEAGDKGVNDAMQSCYDESFAADDPRTTDIGKVEALAEYGIMAPLLQKTGKNLRKLLKEAHVTAQLACMLTGLYFDKRVNMLGATGWDAIKGNLWPDVDTIVTGE